MVRKRRRQLDSLWMNKKRKRRATKLVKAKLTVWFSTSITKRMLLTAVRDSMLPKRASKCLRSTRKRMDSHGKKLSLSSTRRSTLSSPSRKTDQRLEFASCKVFQPTAWLAMRSTESEMRLISKLFLHHTETRVDSCWPNLDCKQFSLRQVTAMPSPARLKSGRRW